MTQHDTKHFSNQAAWQAHLDRLGISALAVTPDPVMVATEGALWGSVKAHGHITDTVIVSDDAGQFQVGQHALCWVHAERLVHKLDTFTDKHRRAQEPVRTLIWWFYRQRLSARPHGAPQGRCASASIGSSSARPPLPPSTGCSAACMPTGPNC